MAARQGQILSDRYRIEQVLGRGGFGYVYRATDIMLSRPVAIKELRPELTQDGAILQRFRNEAIAASNLNHENIVTVYDLLELNGSYYLLMEYVEGGNAASLLARSGKVPVPQTTGIAIAICDALAAVHTHGIIHRDIKPGNILLTKTGTPKLTDFGIALMPRGPADPRITPDGVQVGTVAYMSPEQAKGLAIDHRSDIYSLGATLYEMLTGRPYLDFGENLYANLELIKDKDPVPVRRLCSEVPAGLERIVHKALTKEPSERFRSAQEMKNALSRVAVGTESGNLRLASRLIPMGLGLLAASVIMGTVVLWMALLSTKPPALSMTPAAILARSTVSATPSSTAASVPTQAHSPPTATPVSPTPTYTFRALPSTPTTTPVARTSTPAGSPPASGTCGDIWVRVKDNMKMVYVPEGDIWMGSDIGESDERPVHLVHVRGYWIDELEITNSAFERFVLETGYRTDAETAGSGNIWQNGRWNSVNGLAWRHPSKPGEGISAIMDHPVVQVSWNDADAYCAWAGGRLPSEAEWEMAAVGTTGWTYPWGNEFDSTRLNASLGGTQRVGSYPTGRSPCGSYDMAGNVWEWVSDWYDSNYYAVSPSANPTGPTTGTYKALRGGAWDPSGGDSRSSDRGSLPPSSQGNTIGFRCAANR
jgi:serine/threonine protein kinase